MTAASGDRRAAGPERGPFGELGRWALEPLVDDADRVASERIDAQLRADRLHKVLSECLVLILAPEHVESGRHAMALSFGAALRRGGAAAGAGQLPPPQQQQPAPAAEAEPGAEVRARGVIVGGSHVELLSFPTPSKQKGVKVRLSSTDPSVLVYVVQADTSAGSEGLLGSLRSSLVHLLKTSTYIGTLHQAAVCIVLADVAALRTALRKLEADAGFSEALRQSFVGLPAAARKAEHVIEGIVAELEAAVGSFNVPQVRTVVIEERLEQRAAGEQAAAAAGSEGARTSDSVATQVLGIIESIQLQRAEEVRSADMASSAENVRPMTPSERKVAEAERDAMNNARAAGTAATATPQREAPIVQQPAQQPKGVLRKPVVQLALFGLVVALGTFHILQAMHQQDELN
jgi:hypothetical protein